jgi:dTDP-4-amino-4,6-dideoxygalactose transaminase
MENCTATPHYFIDVYFFNYTCHLLIPVSRPSILEADINAIATVLRNGYVSGDAPNVANFENAFAGVVNRTHGIAVYSCSVALDLGLQALDLQNSDEVIVPSFNIATYLFAVLRTMIAAIDPSTFISSMNEPMHTTLLQ